jgi:hypothetical protein
MRKCTWYRARIYRIATTAWAARESRRSIENITMETISTRKYNQQSMIQNGKQEERYNNK